MLRQVTPRHMLPEIDHNNPYRLWHGDPVWDGIVAGLARPGRNITGISEFSFELAGKRLELLRDAFPKNFRVAVLLQGDANHRRQLAEMQTVAQPLGFSFKFWSIKI